MAEAREGDLKAAVRLFSQAIDVNPPQGLHLVYATRSAARRTLGDLPGAVSDADEAVRHSPPGQSTPYVRQVCQPACARAAVWPICMDVVAQQLQQVPVWPICALACLPCDLTPLNWTAGRGLVCCRGLCSCSPGAGRSGSRGQGLQAEQRLCSGQEGAPVFAGPQQALCPAITPVHGAQHAQPGPLAGAVAPAVRLRHARVSCTSPQLYFKNSSCTC